MQMALPVNGLQTLKKQLLLWNME